MPEWVDRLARSLRYAGRGLARAPSFTLTAVASLALGIAVNTVMFSVVSSLLLRPLGSGDGLVRIGRSAADERTFKSTSWRDLTHLREHAASFERVTGQQIETLTLHLAEGEHPLSAELVGPDYFATLGVPLEHGRDFTAEESRMPGSDLVAVVSASFARRRLAADSTVVGGTIRLNDQVFTIIGVTGDRFTGSFPGVDIDLWIPAGAGWITEPPGARRWEASLQLLARLRPSVSARAAEAELDGLAARLGQADPNEAGRRFVVASARGAHPLFANVLRVFLSLLMAVVVVVLLIACANVAGLLLARARARRGEVAIRLAIGAGRGRVAGQLLMESLLLAALGGAAGIVLSLWPLALLDRLAFIPGPTGAPVFLDLRLDARVLGFPAAASTLTALVFGLAPALSATRLSLRSALQDPRLDTGGSRFRLGRALVVLQVGMSYVLLVGAVLLFRSLRNTDRLDLGFEPDHVLVASAELEPLGYDRPRADRFHRKLLAAVRDLPGVQQAALSSFVPMGGRRGHPEPVRIPGAKEHPGTRRPAVAVAGISDRFFATMRQPLRSGRDFSPADSAAVSRVAIVNETMAHRYWPEGDAVGRRIGLGESFAEHEIVGVVADARFASFGGEIEPLVFVPAFGAGWLHVRASAEPADVLRSIRRLAQGLDADAAARVSGAPLRETMASSMSLIPVRIARAVLGVAGVIALLLAAGGLYGLVSYTTALRVKEIGIRVALGADRPRVFRALVGGAFRLSVLGLGAGLAAAAGVMRLLRGLLYGVSPVDPVTFGLMAGLLLLATLAAGYGAARRALEIDAMSVLRQE